jgi:hypothetical protein
MRLRPFGKYLCIAIVLFLAYGGADRLLAQSGTGTVQGQVTDPSGAAVTVATVLLTTPAGAALTATTNRDGVYEVQGLAPGKYTVKVVAQGFALYEKQGVEINAGQLQKLNIPLSIEEQKQRIEVTDHAAQLDVSPSNNASAIVISGKDLDALSDDPDELQAELEALAGPSAGPNGGQIYIDGFTAGQLPPKSSIREIRINQNPFSAEYDKLGYGRIEIFTKPGTDKFHGQFLLNGNSSAFNSRNPFAAQEPAYESTMFSGNIGGPLSKKASFFFDAQRRDINDTSVVSAVVLDPSFNPVPFSAAVPNPRTRTNIGPRLDYQVSKNNTLTVRYQYWNEVENNNGIGQFSVGSGDRGAALMSLAEITPNTNSGVAQFPLTSQGYNIANTEHTLQVSDTQVFGARIVNETRFQYIREANNQTAQSPLFTVNVLGAFTGGGSSQGNIIDNQDRYELQNYTSIALGKHVLKFGGRLRAASDSNDSASGFNGTYIFPSITAYQTTQQGLNNGLTFAKIQANGGGASQFSVIQGSPLAKVALFDAGLYAQDDWRVLPNVTLSYGLRLETQNHISDHADVAPRIGIAWGIGGGKGSAPKTVLRAGFGIFYDRFAEDLVLNAGRLNGVTQQEFIVTNPPFFSLTTPSMSMLTGSQTLLTTYQIDPDLRAPYIMQAAASLERQISETVNVAVTYLNSRGEHQLLTRNINAPVDPLNPATSRPFGNIGNIYQYESVGIFRQNQLIANVNIRAGSKLSLFGYYTLNYVNSDTAGASSFPSNQYNILQDYGRAAFDVRHRVFLGGTLALPYAFRLSPFLLVSSGVPFNITVSQDLNGDSIFNDRPAFATNLTGPNVVVTRFGAFDKMPAAGEAIVPPNFVTGPGRFTLNLRLSKTFGLGKKLEREGTGPSGDQGRGHGDRGGRGGPFGGFGGGGRGDFGGVSDRRYSLTFSVAARNIFNNVNLATPIGNLNSPLFGESNALAGGPFSSTSANRRIDLQVMFNF